MSEEKLEARPNFGSIDAMLKDFVSSLEFWEVGGGFQAADRNDQARV